MHVMYALQPGGMEFGVIKLVNGLVGTTVRSSICSTTPAHEPPRSLVAGEVPVFELRRRAGNDAQLVWRLMRLFRRERPHVVHTHAWGTLLEGVVAARLAGVPVVVHGEHGTLQLRRHQRVLQRIGWSLADQLLSVSSRLAERMAAEMRFPANRIRTLRNGVDLSRFGATHPREARRALQLPEDGRIVGTVGRLVPVKDQATLIEAVARLRGKGLQVTLVIAGEGPLRGHLQSKAQALGLAADVRLLGHRPDVECVLAALDVFVLPSVSEGLSNTILEAMASGVPVIATRVGGADELVAEGLTGLLVPAGSVEDLASVLSLLLRDDARRRSMGSAARLRAESEFSLPAMLLRYHAMYVDLMARRSGGTGRDHRARTGSDRTAGPRPNLTRSGEP
ncbi:MAG: glycosyltransferase [Acidobacteria bacterium]|nr:glycosyltransferase [Acidobacteriota bacterium]